MKFSQIVSSLAVAGSAAAATYTNSSVPYGDGFFIDGMIYFQLFLPAHIGFTGFDVVSDSTSDVFGFQFDPKSIFGFYEPGRIAFDVSSDTSDTSLDLSGGVDFSNGALAAELYLAGPLSLPKDDYVGLFLINLSGISDPVLDKRAESVFTVTISASTTDALPDGLPFTSTGTLLQSSSSSDVTTGSTTPTSTSTSTATSTDLITITSCEDDKCTTATLAPAPDSEITSTKTHTVKSSTLITITSCEDHECTEKVVPTGVTVVTEDETYYTTYCPLTSEEVTTITATTVYKTTVCETTSTKAGPTPETTVITYTTTECHYYTPTEAPTTTAPTTEAETTTAPTTEAETTTAKTTEAETTTAKTTEAETTTAKTTEAPTTTLESVSTKAPVATSSELSTYTGAAAGVTASGALFSVFAVLMSMLI